MRLCIQQHVFSWRDRFSIWDEAGTLCYEAQGELFSLGKRLHVTDTQGREVLTVAAQLLRFLPHYTLTVGDREVGELVAQWSFLRPSYRVEGLEWEVRGDFTAHSYAITAGERTVATLEKEWFTFGDCYALDVDRPEDLLPALATVLAIDCIRATD